MPRSPGGKRGTGAALAVLALATAAAAALSDSHCGSSPCMYGICVDVEEALSSSYRCYCIDGYTGSNCETNWDECWSQPCLNGGTCHDAVAAYNCSCPEGFVGLNCEQRYSQCSSQPCQNNATCSERDHAGVSCQCLEGFSGEFCQIDEAVCNASVCQNAGECSEGPGLSFSCRCADGWLGARCERDLDECSLAAPCRNGGLCINLPGDYQCVCLFGFTGKDCDKPLLACRESPCLNGAVCLLEDGRPVCYCVPDFHGPLCELRYDDCQSKSAHCQNGGSCIDGVDSFSCSCPPPFVGDNCASVSEEPAAEGTSAAGLPPSATSAPLGPSSTELAVEIGAGGEQPLETTSGPAPDRGATEARTEPEPATEPGIDAGLDPDLDSSPEPAGVTTTGATTVASEPGTESTSGTSASGERPEDADVAETTLSAAASTSAAGVVTMLPSSIPGPEPEPEASAPPSLPPPEAASTPADEDFTSLPDFHRSTFGSELDASSTPPSGGTERPGAGPGPGPACDVERCANASRCPQDAAQCDCGRPDDCAPRAGLTSAAFNGKSYARQRFDIESGELSVRLRLRSRASSGILLHALFDDERYALLYLEAGQLKFQFSCGLQTMLFGELDSPLGDAREADLEMRFRYIAERASDRCSARLLVNGSEAMSGEQLLHSHGSAPRLARLHVGGIPLAFSRQFPPVVLGFVGCMSLLEVNGLARDFARDSVEVVQLEECHSFLCLPNPCRNFGACRQLADGAGVECSCIAGYSGEFCERSVCDEEPCQLGATCLMSPGVSFLCVCPLGAHGLFCERDASIAQPSFSVPAPGFSSYMAYGLSGSPRDGLELAMRIAPRNPEQISLLAYMGQSGPRRDSPDHLALTYVRGYLMLTWDLGSGVRRIFTASPISVRARRDHALRVGRRGRDAWLYVEGVGNVSARAAGSNTRLDVSPILYIGGHKAKYFDSLPHDLPLHSGFSGCIYDLELRTDDSFPPLTTASPATGRGVGECHRNECSHHSCKNGAVCLNYGPTYSCICMKDWQGPDCADRVNCTSSNSCH
ncbi:protein eyes shut [Phymastichus coffea]|uniref:protein eyes shut n=1 Tax=Phymastichus coffea TaxID=108790 RepID=UPI00273C8D38|nr:protein eyes shut [Phymastichus coffea]